MAYGLRRGWRSRTSGRSEDQTTARGVDQQKASAATWAGTFLPCGSATGGDIVAVCSIAPESVLASNLKSKEIPIWLNPSMSR
jgi:hypothetical protein